MKSREKIAHNYLIFRYPTEYVLVFFPIMVGVIINIFSGLYELPEETPPPTDTFLERQFAVIDNFLLGSKITMIILISFFICYRWASMLNDGSYGFWLTTGVVRRVFFFRTIIKFGSLMLFSQTIGLLVVFYLSNVILQPEEYIQLFVGMLANILFLIIISVYLANRMRNPEFASITFLTIMGFNIGFNNDGILFDIFQSDLAFRGENALIGSLISIVVSIILIIITLRIHLQQDIDI